MIAKEIIAPDCACASLITPQTESENVKHSSFSQRLRALIGEDSVSKFARRCGIGESTLRAYLAGTEPGLSKSLQIWKATGCSIGWLVTGRGEMHGSPEQLPRTTPKQDWLASRYVHPQPHVSPVISLPTNWLDPVYDHPQQPRKGLNHD